MAGLARALGSGVKGRSKVEKATETLGDPPHGGTTSKQIRWVPDSWCQKSHIPLATYQAQQHRPCRLDGMKGQRTRQAVFPFCLGAGVDSPS